MGWRTTAEVAATQERLARWLHGGFRRKLSLEDARDVAAQTIAELHASAVPVRNPGGLLRRAAHRNALDLVRAREGETASGPRPAAAALDDHAHTLAHPSAEAEAGRLGDVQERVAAYEALAAAMAALPVRESLALALRHVDRLDVPTCASLLGLSRTQYERLHTRAMNRLRDTLAAPERDPVCRLARRLLDHEALDAAEVARRDAHLDSCLPCRAYALRRG
jgi:DNA-directed RNA polymerase specialized sigma24 family protein